MSSGLRSSSRKPKLSWPRQKSPKPRKGRNWKASSAGSEAGGRGPGAAGQNRPVQSPDRVLPGGDGGNCRRRSFNAHGNTPGFPPYQPYDFTLWKDEARDYSQQLNTILIAARKYSFALERHQDAEDEHAQITRELDQLIHNHKTLEEQQDSLKEQWLQDFHHWEVCTQELKLTPQEKQQTARF